MSKTSHPELERQEMPLPYWRRQQVLDIASTRLDMTWSQIEGAVDVVRQTEQTSNAYLQAVQSQPESKIGAPILENTVNDPAVARANVELAFPQQQANPMKDHYHVN